MQYLWNSKLKCSQLFIRILYNTKEQQPSNKKLQDKITLA